MCWQITAIEGLHGLTALRSLELGSNRLRVCLPLWSTPHDALGSHASSTRQLALRAHHGSADGATDGGRGRAWRG